MYIVIQILLLVLKLESVMNIRKWIARYSAAWQMEDGFWWISRLYILLAMLVFGYGVAIEGYRPMVYGESVLVFVLSVLFLCFVLVWVGTRPKSFMGFYEWLLRNLHILVIELIGVIILNLIASLLIRAI